MPKITTKTEYGTVTKEYNIKEYYKNVKEFIISHEDDLLDCDLVEDINKGITKVKGLDEIVIFKPNYVNISPTDQYSGSVFEKQGGCALIAFKPVKSSIPEDLENILVCSEELKDKIDESKLNKLVDLITYP